MLTVCLSNYNSVQCLKALNTYFPDSCDQKSTNLEPKLWFRKGPTKQFFVAIDNFSTHHFPFVLIPNALQVQSWLPKYSITVPARVFCDGPVMML